MLLCCQTSFSTKPLTACSYAPKLHFDCFQNIPKELCDPNNSEVEKTEEAKGDGEQVDNTLARVDHTKDASTQDNQTATLISFTQKGTGSLDSNYQLRLALSVSSGFGNQFLAHSFDISLFRTFKDNTDAEINSMLDIQIQHEVLNVQALSMLTVPVLVILEQFLHQSLKSLQKLLQQLSL
ncbi:hypothetical protein Tco_1089892 [Tanacetum coccineum]|uniref:Uncharacterized protein n=1 Tax=Tanacetum coccineum TaxID=301880 RepID=A0ABQ5I2Q0_9ASTR